VTESFLQNLATTAPPVDSWMPNAHPACWAACAVELCDKKRELRLSASNVATGFLGTKISYRGCVDGSVSRCIPRGFEMLRDMYSNKRKTRRRSNESWDGLLRGLCREVEVIRRFAGEMWRPTRGMTMSRRFKPCIFPCEASAKPLK
jgi:hypothetical protein